MKRKILFLTGTRADFGKLKPLIRTVSESSSFEYSIFATGMHVLSRYGCTVDEIYKAGFTNIHTFMNQIYGEPMEMVLANTVTGLSRYVHENRPDLIVVHGDRVEALAGAIVGALRNVLVAHIEGGELSGTVDELIRHSVSKLSHLHFVANKTAAERLMQLGENENSIYIIGSPDIDIMMSDSLPSMQMVRERYEIRFDQFAIVAFHPVTTELQRIGWQAEELVSALIESGLNYVVIHPNNDEGCEDILKAYEKLAANPRFRFFPSLRFEYFLALLKNATFIVGNSSAGIHEAPVFAVPTVNVGTRQRNRFCHESILEVGHEKSSILSTLQRAAAMRGLKPCHHFGDGRSAEHFRTVLETEVLWRTPHQKQFRDILVGHGEKPTL